VPMDFVAVRDRFGQSGEPEELYQAYGLTAEKIKEACLGVLRRK